MTRQFKRHDRSDIFMHWFNAACWIILLVTGVGLIGNPDLDPVGSWYPRTLRALVGGGANLLNIHLAVGFIWIFAFVGYLAINARGALFFLREIFMVSPARDMGWMIRKMVIMTLGPKVLRKLGMNPDLPAQGFYNMGQKAFAQASVVGGVIIAVTGIIMFLSDKVFTAQGTWIVSWSITLHFVAVGLVFAGLLVHIYMAAISPEERPGFKSMFTGSVPEDYARHHHGLWYDSVKSENASTGDETG